jgi:transposase
MKTCTLEDLIVLDESGAHLAMTRRDGRIASHQRLQYAAPYARGSQYSMISAISTQAIVASLYCEQAIEGDFFTGCLDTQLMPHVTPRHCIIMDNVAVHKVKRAVKLIEKTGAKIVYLPPYSPDLSPIEWMGSKINSVLKKQAASTVESFQEALSLAFHAISPRD